MKGKRGMMVRSAISSNERVLTAIVGLSIVAILLGPGVAGSTPAQRGSAVQVAAPTSSQSITLQIADATGNPISGASVQGEIFAPPSMGGGFVNVLNAMAADGEAVISNLTALRAVESGWYSQLGSVVSSESHPDLVLFVTYSLNNQTYFQESSIPLAPAQLLFNPSFAEIASITVSPSMKVPNAVEATLASQGTNLEPATLPSPQFCNDYVTYCWIAYGSEQLWPSSGYGQVPVAWGTGSGNSWNDESFAMAFSNSLNFNLGLLAGAGSNIAKGGFGAGATVWSTGASGSRDNTINPTNGSAYVYLDAQAAGQEFQEYECGAWALRTQTCIYYVAMNEYQYDAGIVNVQVTNGVIQGGTANGLPPYNSQITQNFTETFYGEYTGTGDRSAPHYQVNSNQFVDTYLDSQTQWLSVSVSVGALISEACPECAIPAFLLLQLVGSVTQSDNSVSMAWIQFDGPLNQPIYIYLWVGTSTYYVGSGSGSIPLMDIWFFAPHGGGGGCVAWGTPILTPSGYVPVQSLKPGDAVEEYDFATQSLVQGTFLSGNTTRVTQLVDVNDGLLYLTPTDQPIYIENATFVGWLHDPQNLSTADQIFDPVTREWIPVTTVILTDHKSTVFDVVTSGSNNFVANGILLDRKA